MQSDINKINKEGRVNDIKKSIKVCTYSIALLYSCLASCRVYRMVKVMKERFNGM